MEQLSNIATLITIVGFFISVYCYFKKHPVNISKSLIEKRTRQLDWWVNKPFNVITLEGTPQLTISPRAICFIIIELSSIYILVSLIIIASSMFHQAYEMGKTIKGLLIFMCAVSAAFGFTEYMKTLTGKNLRLNRMIIWLIFTLIPFYILECFYN